MGILKSQILQLKLKINCYRQEQHKDSTNEVLEVRKIRFSLAQVLRLWTQ